jgi:hypothetical protein
MEKASEEELSGLIQPDTTRLNKNWNSIPLEKVMVYSWYVLMRKKYFKIVL